MNLNLTERYRQAEIDMRAAAAAYRTTARQARKAFDYLNCSAPIDSVPYSDREYRYYSEKARRAMILRDRAIERVDSLEVAAAMQGM